MVLYSVDKLIEQARTLAAEYRRATGKTMPGISLEIAEYDACRLLDMTLCEDRQTGIDAIGKGAREGKRVQIKGRTIFDESKSSPRIGQIRVEQPWDSIILVLLDEEYQPFEIYEAEREDVLDVLDKASTAQKKRGALSIARFRIIGQLVWTREDGLEDSGYL